MRVGIGALLLAALIAAFSLQQQPRPLSADVTATAFDSTRGVALLDELASRYPSRRAGSAGDQALATRVGQELQRALPAATLQTEQFRADTPDGSRTLRNVSVTLLGQPGPEIVVVAHRDALERGSRAELSGTAGLIMLARAVGQARFKHTIRFVSTTGASGGGLSGATRLARTLDEPVSAVLVLGDLAGGRSRPSQVVPWSNSVASGPLRWQRTVESALRSEGLHPTASEGLWPQLVRRGLPATVGEQGELNQAGFPSVLLSAGGAPPPAANAPVDAQRFGAYGRSALRSMHAVDAIDGTVGPQQTGLVVAGQELPAWALRVLLLAVLLPMLGAALVVGLSLARDRHPLAAGAAWTAGCAVGPLVAALVAVGLGRIGVVWPATPAPYAGQAIRTGTGAWFLVVVLLAILVATVAIARPVLTREATGRLRPTRITVAVAVFGMVALVLAVLVVTNPLAAVLLLPAALAWPAAIAPLPFLQPLHRVGLTALGALLPLAAAITVMGDLDVPVTQVPWWLVLLAAGGHITPFTLLLLSLVLGAFIATCLTLVPAATNRWLARFQAQRRERRERRHDDDDPLPADEDETTPGDEGMTIRLERR